MTMKKILFLLPLLLTLALVSCNDLQYAEQTTEEVLRRFGWLMENETPGEIPLDVTLFDGDVSALPSSFSIEHIYPPIGNQGPHGTCVTWAVGYNLKTALNGIEKNWSDLDLGIAINQTSPADLWKAISPSNKEAHCDGVVIEYALDALLVKGAKNLFEEPYVGSDFCAWPSNGDANNRILNYRTIGYNGKFWNDSRSPGMTISNFKGYIAQGRPIAFGARLGDRFMAWNSSAVLDYDTYDAPDMKHAYHVMVISAYDDSKRAFRVRNSWGPRWGDEGSIWIDYDFFVENFCYAAFVAQNPGSRPPNNQSRYDLLVASAEDFADPDGVDARDRAFTYEVYNNGSLAINASHRWSVTYLYYNAYNASDMELIYQDYYTDEFGNPGEAGDYAESPAIAGGRWNHSNLLPGQRAGEAEFDNGFYITYRMPEITGDYYLVVWADRRNVIPESNKENNFYFITAENGKPMRFHNGVMLTPPAPPAGAALAKKTGTFAPASSVAQLGQPNAYTPQELELVLNQMEKDGRLAQKAEKYRADRNSGRKAVKRHKRSD